MLKLHLSLLCGLLCLTLQAQLLNDGATIIVQDGATLYVEGNIINQNAGSITNDGTIEVTGDFTNNATAAHNADSKVIFSGDSDSHVTSNGADFAEVVLNKDAGLQVILADDARVTEDIDFMGDDNLLTLGTHTLAMSNTATITGADDNEYVNTNSTGVLTKEGMSTFTFPVGNGSYTPMTMTEAGASDDKSVRVLANPLVDGDTGAAITEDAVDAAWVVTESTAGGSDLTVTPGWSATDHLTGLDINDLGVARYDGAGYDLTIANLGAASGSDPYTATRAGFTDVGTFIVGGDPALTSVKVAPRVFLAGPYNGTDMNDNLRAANLIPLTEPYTAMTQFTHVGRGGGESVSALADFNETGTDDDIVDWMFLELRDQADNTAIVATAAALLQRDGDIVGTDGNAVSFTGVEAGDYYLAIRHRNHLGIMTAGAETLSKTPISLDFTDGSAATWGTNAQRDFLGKNTLWAGDVNRDNLIRYQGVDNDNVEIQNSVGLNPGNFFNSLGYSFSEYSVSDVNLDGIIKYQGADNDNVEIQNSIGLNPGNFFNSLGYSFTGQIPN